jgi:hypothetical protein
MAEILTVVRNSSTGKSKSVGLLPLHRKWCDFGSLSSWLGRKTQGCVSMRQRSSFVDSPSCYSSCKKHDPHHMDFYMIGLLKKIHDCFKDSDFAGRNPTTHCESKPGETARLCGFGASRKQLRVLAVGPVPMKKILWGRPIAARRFSLSLASRSGEP